MGKLVDFYFTTWAWVWGKHPVFSYLVTVVHHHRYRTQETVVVIWLLWLMVTISVLRRGYEPRDERREVE